mmetsp:Transcript_5517/g.11281  ORF Transcript_5517/g.11281 Transcript_5517/m.11281 type:complete len:522 (+) Transcript_5517:315-1880(+)
MMITLQKISMSISDSFGARVESALLKGGSFKQPMTRPLMLLAVFEANRILLAKATAAKNDNAKSMRPFQRKIALLAIAMDLIYSLDFLSESEKLEIIGKTRKEGTKVDSKPVLAKLAFHRGDTLQKEVEAKFIPMMKKFMNETGQDVMQSHEELCNAFCQNKYEKISGKSGDRPKFWELRRMPLFAVYRVYYREFKVDEDVFPAEAPREIQMKDMPSKRPDDLSDYVFGTWAPIGTDVKPFANDEAAAGTAQDEAMEDGERVANATPSPRVRRAICNRGRVQPDPRKNKNRNVVRMPIVAVDNAESNEKIASAPAAVATPKPRANKVLKMMPHVGVAKNIQILLQIKTRMRLLKELEVEGVLPQKRIQREKRMLLRAFPPLASSTSGIAKKKAASAATKSVGEHCPRVHLMETNLRMELLKEMKDMMPPKRYGNEMKQLFLGLPSLPSAVSKMDEKKSCKENADVSDEEDKKVDEEEMQFEVVKNSVDGDDGIDEDGAWEDVDGTVNMEEMNESVSAIGLA